MQSVPVNQTRTQVVVNNFVRSVYNWMAVGLGLTGFVAFAVANNESLLRIVFGNQMLFFGLIIAELGLVFYLSARVSKISPATAPGLFVLYAGLNGVTISYIFIVYTASSIASTFYVCAATFVA